MGNDSRAAASSYTTALVTSLLPAPVRIPCGGVCFMFWGAGWRSP